MEGLNKFLGTRVLATGATARPLDGHLDMRMLGHFRLKGFEKAVAVHELLGPIEDASRTSPWREAFAEGLQLFRKKEFARARNAFERVLELNPKDGPSLFYIGLMTEMLPEFMPEHWIGDVEIKEK
jgi:adenylate cyclase